MTSKSGVWIEPLPVEGETFVDFGAMLRANAAATPAKTALIVGARRATWGGLGDAVARYATVFRKSGIGPGSTVAALGEPSLPYMVAYCAVTALGACMVPLPAIASDEALTTMLGDCGAGLLLASEAMHERAGMVASARPDLVDLPRMGLDFEGEGWPGIAAAIAAAAPLTDWPEVGPDALFNIIYSSGTTGVPKGIVHDQLFRTRQLRRMREFGLDETRTMFVATAMYSNTTLVPALAALGNGGTLVMMPKFDADDWFDSVETERPTHAMLVPVLVQRLLVHPRFGTADLSSISATIVTSAPFAPEVKKRAVGIWPGTLFEMYGLTEGGLTSALNATANPGKLDSVGKPSATAEIRIVNEEGAAVAPGEIGEIVGRSPTMMRGYHGRDDLTEKALIRLDGATFFRTGDLGRFDEEGFLYVVGRAKDVIISGGFNIYATDLEDALLGHPDVLDACVIGVPSEQWGETPMAFVVPVAGAAPDPEDLRQFANSRLGRVQRISEVRCLADLPRNALGKVVKADLRRIAEADTVPTE